MPENEIIAGIHRHREAFARECHFAVQEMARRYRAEQERSAAAGHPVVSFVHEAEVAGSCLGREHPPKPGGSQNSRFTD